MLGGSLFHLVGSIGAEAWGCVEWYDEENEKPIEAYGWMRRKKVGEEDWLMLKLYHGSLVRKALRYEQGVKVLCCSEEVGEMLVSLMELYGTTMELMADSWLVSALDWHPR